MKIVNVITGLNTGGAEMMLLKVLGRLDPTFSPHVISLTDIGSIGQRIQALGIPVQALNLRRGVIPGPLAFFRLVWWLKEIKPDVVHTWMYHADLLGGVAARIARVPAVGWAIRHSNLDRDKTRISTRQVAVACALISRFIPDKILVCSEVARRIHVALGYVADKMWVIPNGFDLAQFQPDEGARQQVRVELGVGRDTQIIGLIGRFDPQKNHKGFMEAARSLHQKRPEVHFLLAGKEIDENNFELMSAVREAGVGGVVHLLGLRSDIPRLMAALDVLVSSSSYGEAFPNVLGEAMACGVPCVVTDVGDSAFIVGDTGRVVSPGDMPGLAEEMEALLALPHAEWASLSVRARDRVAKYFEIGQIARQYEAFYSELAETGRRRKKRDLP